MQHAPLPPSSADRIHLCHGSAAMERAMGPQDDTQDTRDGHAAHWAAQQCLAGQPVAVGQVADNGVVLNDEMVRGAEMYAKHIMSRGPVGKVEERVVRSALHPDNWGTPDHWFYDHMARTLYVDDFKFGHRYIDVRGNWQLINYAALILSVLGMTGEYDIRVVFTIVQPRSYGYAPVRTWATTVRELVPLWQVLSADFHAASQPGAKTTPSVPACRDCSARHDCPGLTGAINIALDITGQATPLNLSPEAMSRELRVLKQAEGLIKAKREGMEQNVLHTIRRKRSVPFFALEHRGGREVWADNAVDSGLVHAANLYGVDVTKPALITPLQAIQAGVPPEVVRLYSKMNSGAAELVEDDGSTAARLFNQ